VWPSPALPPPSPVFTNSPGDAAAGSRMNCLTPSCHRTLRKGRSESVVSMLRPTVAFPFSRCYQRFRPLFRIIRFTELIVLFFPNFFSIYCLPRRMISTTHHLSLNPFFTIFLFFSRDRCGLQSKLSHDFPTPHISPTPRTSPSPQPGTRPGIPKNCCLPSPSFSSAQSQGVFYFPLTSQIRFYVFPPFRPHWALSFSPKLLHSPCSNFRRGDHRFFMDGPNPPCFFYKTQNGYPWVFPHHSRSYSNRPAVSGLSEFSGAAGLRSSPGLRGDIGLSRHQRHCHGLSNTPPRQAFICLRLGRPSR